LNNGFHNSLQNIADTVHITKKTLFNRYLSKENLEFCLLNYWQIISTERLDQRMEFANNAVEKLIMFLFELQYCKNNEVFFFNKMKEIFFEKTIQINPLISKLEDIFLMGVKEKLFQFDFDLSVFAYYFLFNTSFLILSNDLIYTEYISFLLGVILTDKGKTVFEEIDIELVFKKS
jgi:hypothetical protein